MIFNKNSEKGISLILLLIILIIFLVIGIVTIIISINKNTKETEYNKNSEVIEDTINTGTIQDINELENEINSQEYMDMIGKYVNYKPENGTYSMITGDATYSGTDKNKSDFITEDFGWRIWSIDNEKLVLISDDITKISGKNGELYLEGAVGYNNAVKILNDICKECYSNTTFGAIGKCPNIKDIENVLDKNIWNPDDYFNSIPTKNLSYYKVTDYKFYPYIYQFEEYSDIDGNKVEKGLGIARNVQEELYSSKSYKFLEASSYIGAVFTDWSTLGEDSFSSKNFINDKYFELIFNVKSEYDIKNNEYWLSSRGAESTEKALNKLGEDVGNGIWFRVQCVCCGDARETLNTEKLPISSDLPRRYLFSSIIYI